MSLLLPFGRLTTRGRRLVARHRWLRWCPVLAASSMVVLSTAAYQQRSDAARRVWGDTIAVWVAADELRPGDPLAADRRQVPLALVPDGALPAGTTPADQVVRQHLAAGSIITTLDVTRGNGSDALIPTGWRGVAVAEAPSSGADIGDRVDVVSDGVVLASSAVVTGRHDDTVLVAVPAGAAPLIALADQTGVALLRVPAGEPEP